MQKLKAYNWTPVAQSLLDIAIKGGVFIALLVIDYISTALSNGTVQLPYPAATLPIATLIVSQLDSYFVQWAQRENVSIPSTQ